MRVGDDRQSLGERVFSLLFPDGASLIRGLAVGADREALKAAMGDGGAEAGFNLTWSYPVDDPHGSGRQVHITARMSGDRVSGLTARVISRDRMDVDASWRLCKEKLDSAWGQPSRQLGGALVLSWRHPASEPNRPFSASTRGSRFQNDAKENILEFVYEGDRDAEARIGAR
jgi:hypothetical protein